MASNAAACTCWRVSMKRTASSACSVLRKWLPTADCSTSLTRLRMVPTIEMTFGAVVSGTWICTCRSMRNTKPSRLFADDRRQLRVEVVRFRRRVGPVEREDERRHDLGVVDARVQRVLAGAQRLLPDPAVAGPHDRPELELRARRVERRQPDERLDDRDLALVHHEHRHEVDAHEERVQQVRAVEQRVVLESDLAAGVEELLDSPDSCCAGCSCCRAAARCGRRR